MHAFELEIEFRGEIIPITGTLQQWGYTHKIILDIKGVAVTLEPDEERNYRALVAPADMHQLPGELIGKVVAEIEQQLG